MEDLSLKEQKKIAKLCAQKGMPLSKLKSIGIDISTFPPEYQAELYGMSARNRIDQSIEAALEEETER